MTASELATYDTGPALVAYLAQPDASASVCDSKARGPHVGAPVAPMREAFVRGLTDGRVAPEIWEPCADALLKRATPDEAASLLDEIGHAYKSTLKDGKLETSPELQARVATMQKLYLERKNRIHDAHDELKSLFADLRVALEKKRLGPVATRFGEELVAAVDLEDGKWRGRAVDASTLDSLDEPTLRLFVDRLPSEDLRNEAKRRIVRRHIDASPYPEVRANADDVEERVLIRGANVLELDKQAPVRGFLDERNVPMRGVLVRQDVFAQTATLLGYRNDAPPLSILPELRLRNALMVEVSGVSRPVTICAPKKELDPTPCIDAASVRIGNPVAYLDKGGVFRFVDRISMRDAVALTSLRDRFELPIDVAGKPLASFVWPFHYERPASVVLGGAVSGSDGPHLLVKIDHRDPSRYVFDVETGKGGYLAVVEAYDAKAFVVASRGAQGFGGSAGSSGSSGSSGGECSNGGDGGPGGPGGDGGPGGNGGDVDVEIACSGESCNDALAFARTNVASLGGLGGSGGPGGSGGSGGIGRLRSRADDAHGRKRQHRHRRSRMLRGLERLLRLRRLLGLLRPARPPGARHDSDQ